MAPPWYRLHYCHKWVSLLNSTAPQHQGWAGGGGGLTHNPLA